jgi:hypothetical protein
VKVRIVSNGKSRTKIIHVESGQEIENVLGVYLQLEHLEDPIAAIEILAPQIDISATAKLINCCPHCGAEKEASAAYEQKVMTEKESKTLGLDNFFEQVDNCKNCNCSVTIQLQRAERSELDLDSYCSIHCYNCDRQVDAENFFKALEKWKIINEHKPNQNHA